MDKELAGRSHSKRSSQHLNTHVGTSDEWHSSGVSVVSGTILQ